MRSIRLNSMEQYILQQGTVSLQDLSKHFDISINTIRRDLDELQKRGHVTKVYGGVAAVSQTPLVPIPIRSNLNREGKEHIGRLAASLVPDISTIFLDSGSTTINMIKYLTNRRGLSILTHSLPVLVEASGLSEINLLSLGGIFNAATGSFVGISTLEVINTLTINMAFMAASGVSIERGLSNNTYFEAEIKRGIVAHSKKIILLADHTKFGNDALISFCDLKKLTAIITDRQPPQKYINFFKENGIQLLY